MLSFLVGSRQGLAITYAPTQWQVTPSGDVRKKCRVLSIRDNTRRYKCLLEQPSHSSSHRISSSDAYWRRHGGLLTKLLSFRGRSVPACYSSFEISVSRRDGAPVVAHHGWVMGGSRRNLWEGSTNGDFSFLLLLRGLRTICPGDKNFATRAGGRKPKRFFVGGVKGYFKFGGKCQ